MRTDSNKNICKIFIQLFFVITRHTYDSFVKCQRPGMRFTTSEHELHSQQNHSH